MTFRIDPGAWAQIHQLAEQARKNVLGDIAADARRFVPVDTGELRSSIRVDDTTAEVVADAEHAGYVELGTSRMAAQPYLRPALYKRRNIRVDGV